MKFNLFTRKVEPSTPEEVDLTHEPGVSDRGDGIWLAGHNPNWRP